jgi:hypothetical protein
MAVLLSPVDTVNEFHPIAVLLLPIKLEYKAPAPNAMFLLPVVFWLNVASPNAVFADPVVFEIRASLPKTVLLVIAPAP